LTDKRETIAHFESQIAEISQWYATTTMLFIIITAVSGLAWW